MEISKVYSKKSFNIIILFMLLAGIGVNAGLYFGMEWLLNVPDLNGSWLMDKVNLLFNNFNLWVVPAVSGIFLLAGCFLWLLLKSSVSKLFRDAQLGTDEKMPGEKSKKDFVDQKIEQDKKRRLFLHSLSVLQRDGRLLDFFDEDLSLYADDQIGAAVRSIQEDCKKTIKKYINPKPVMDREEGDTITIESGFDIDSITLVGNVSGGPPFEGVLKHRGWKAGKKEIPKLSNIQDSTIMIPAEIEVK